jgi:hypothetical protein
MNIYQELFTTKIVDKLWPSSGDHDIINEGNNQKNVSSNNIAESLFQKIALSEFETSIYNQIICSKILYFFYEKIVLSEMHLIRNNSVNTILVNPLNKTLSTENKISASNSKYFKTNGKKLSLNILQFGNFMIL